jgi:hypothetical protein
MPKDESKPKTEAYNIELASISDFCRNIYSVGHIPPIFSIKKNGKYIITVPIERFDDFSIMYCIKNDSDYEFCSYTPKDEDSNEIAKFISKPEESDYKKIDMPIIKIENEFFIERKPNLEDFKMVKAANNESLIRAFLISLKFSGSPMSRIYTFPHKNKIYMGTFMIKDRFIYAEIEKQYKSNFVNYDDKNNTLEFTKVAVDNKPQLAIINLAKEFPFFNDMPE